MKFGSFKNIQHLVQKIDKMPPRLRSHILIVYINGWYVPVAYYTKNRKALSKKLAPYRRYFPDVRIAKSTHILNYPLVKSYTKKKTRVKASRPTKFPITYGREVARQTTQPIPEERVVEVQPSVIESVPSQSSRVVTSAEENLLDKFLPKVKRDASANNEVGTTLIVPTIVKENDFDVVEHKQYRAFSKQMLSGQYYYLAYRGTDKNPNLLIRVSFESDEVTYQPVIGDMKMTKASYIVKEGRLYMYSDDFNENGAFSKLEEHRANHFLVSSWINGKKLNTLRYYYKLNDAKQYLGIKVSNGLAEVLEDGDFSEYTWY